MDEAIDLLRRGRARHPENPAFLANLASAHEARVLVALRDPRDVCLSCFMQRFLLDDSMINFCSLEQTAETYAAVMDLWLAYRDSLTLAWREFRYEDLVEDFEAVVRGLLAFVGLDWHEAVAGYREQAERRGVATPSYRQVTREIYRESIGRWRAYSATATSPHGEPNVFPRNAAPPAVTTGRTGCDGAACTTGATALPP
jgi:hypothetical protein